MIIDNFDSEFLEPTANNFGYMHTKSIITDEFVSFSKKALNPVVDIGSAYGIATIKCLEQGAKVIAVDISQEHLDILYRRAPLTRSSLLQTLLARFPDEMDLESNSVSAVLLSHVLSFLEGDEIVAGMKKVYEWLCEGGKIFILNYTPYHKTVFNFIPVYEARKKKGIKWPGLITDKTVYTDGINLTPEVPLRMNLMDIDILKSVAEKIGFHIEMLRYIGGKNEGVPQHFCLDGREWVGMIARK